MSKLADRHCQPLEKGSPPLPADEIQRLAKDIGPEWSVSDNSKSIKRAFKFNNYYETMAFANVVAMVAHQQDHHPDMMVSYNTCNVIFSTHSVGGLSENDFICAAKINRALDL